MSRVTDEDRRQAREFIDGTIATQAALGYQPTAPATVIEQAVAKVARATADLRYAAERRRDAASAR